MTVNVLPPDSVVQTASRLS